MVSRNLQNFEIISVIIYQNKRRRIEEYYRVQSSQSLP
jgi:hypothetical protein